MGCPPLPETVPHDDLPPKNIMSKRTGKNIKDEYWYVVPSSPPGRNI